MMRVDSFFVSDFSFVEQEFKYVRTSGILPKFRYLPSVVSNINFQCDVWQNTQQAILRNRKDYDVCRGVSKWYLNIKGQAFFLLHFYRTVTWNYTCHSCLTSDRGLPIESSRTNSVTASESRIHRSSGHYNHFDVSVPRSAHGTIYSLVPYSTASSRWSQIVHVDCSTFIQLSDKRHLRKIITT